MCFHAQSHPSLVQSYHFFVLNTLSFEFWQHCLVSALIYWSLSSVRSSRDFPSCGGLLVLWLKAGGDYNAFRSYMRFPRGECGVRLHALRLGGFLCPLAYKQVVILYSTGWRHLVFYFTSFCASVFDVKLIQFQIWIFKWCWMTLQMFPKPVLDETTIINACFISSVTLHYRSDASFSPAGLENRWKNPTDLTWNCNQSPSNHSEHLSNPSIIKKS